MKQQLNVTKQLYNKESKKYQNIQRNLNSKVF